MAYQTVVETRTDNSRIGTHTVLPGAEERGVQHHSLGLFLIFSILADLRSYLRS